MNRTIVVLLLIAGCGTPPIDTGGGIGHSQAPITMRITNRGFTGATGSKLDLLFMVDNSNSMEAMQTELKRRFPSMVQVFSDLAAAGLYADLHIGVVTSDYGAGATGAPGCQPSPGGQGARLQRLGAAAATGCLPPTGGNFIEYAFAPGGNDQSNLPANQDLASTFACMASVGANGCGFEHQLESVYAALHNGPPENQGFLRPDAVLAVVFVTNEDDSSAPPDTDMFDNSLTVLYGFEDSYRQTRFGVVCCPPGMASCTADQLQLTPYGDSLGLLAQCQPAPNPARRGPGQEYDVSRYIDFFTAPTTQGGVKNDPNDVVLVSVAAPDNPVQVILSNPGTAGGTPYAQCPQFDPTSNPPCVPVLQHSCQNPAAPVFFGDPAVRLNAVINSVPNHAVASICEDDFTIAMQKVGAAAVSQIGMGCLPYQAPLQNGTPAADCTVEDDAQNPDGTHTVSQLPSCAAGAFPCWRIQADPMCSSVRIAIDRQGNPAPDNTTTTATCIPPA
jgi:hypothetical protein